MSTNNTATATAPHTKRNSGKPKATLPTPAQQPDELAKAKETAKALAKAEKDKAREAAKAERERVRAEAKAKEAEHAAEVSVQFAGRMARLFDDTKSVFDRAKACYQANQKGANLQTVAAELSMIRAKAAYPEATEMELEFYASNPSGKGGTQISKASLHAYASAWASIVDEAQLPADTELVGLAFRLYSKGGTANSRKEAEVQASALVASGNTDEARALYIRAAHLNLRGVNMFETGLSSKSDDKTDPDAVEVEVVSKTNKLNREAILGQIASWKNAVLSDDDLDVILEALAEFAADVQSVREAEVNA
jgi:hypothetical protein